MPLGCIKARRAMVCRYTKYSVFRMFSGSRYTGDCEAAVSPVSLLPLVISPLPMMVAVAMSVLLSCYLLGLESRLNAPELFKEITHLFLNQPFPVCDLRRQYVLSAVVIDRVNVAVVLLLFRFLHLSYGPLALFHRHTLRFDNRWNQKIEHHSVQVIVQ